MNGTKTKVLKMASKASKMTKKRDGITKKVAEMHGVSDGYVRKIRRGDAHNEEIFATVMDMIEGENKLIQEVKRLIPIDKKREKRPKTTLKDLEDRSKEGQLTPQKHLY